MQDVTLNNGVTMPILGFGVYQVPPADTQRVVEDALAAVTATSTPPPGTATSRPSERRSGPAACPARTCSSPPSCGSRTPGRVVQGRTRPAQRSRRPCVASDWTTSTST